MTVSAKNIFSNIGANYLRSLIGVLLLLFLFPILGDIYDDVFTSSPNWYLVTLFVVVASTLGIYIGECVSYIWYKFVGTLYFRDSENFIGFPPWEVWNDDVFNSYKQEILSRTYLIISVSLAIPLIFLYICHENFFESKLDLGDEVEGWVLLALITIISLAFLLPTISLIYLTKGRLIFWKTAKQNKTYISNLFGAEVRTINDVKRILYKYLVIYTFYGDARILAYLKMIAVVHTNSENFLKLRKWKNRIVKNEKEEEIDHEFWIEFDLFEENAELASKQVKDGNFNTAKLQFVVGMRRFLVYLMNDINESMSSMKIILEGERKSLIKELEEVINVNIRVEKKERAEDDPYTKDLVNLTYQLILAKSEYTGWNVLDKLAYSSSKKVKIEVAKNKGTHSDTLNDLSEDSDQEIRFEVYKNPSTSSEIIIKKQQEIGILKAVAGNESALQDTLRVLSNTAWPEIRLTVARNRSTPDYILERMVEDQNPDIKKAIAENSGTPRHILEKLLRDEDAEIRKRVASNQSTPVHFLEELSNDIYVYVRKSVAENINTTENILQKLADDYSEEVQKSVAENTNTSGKILEELVENVFFLANDIVGIVAKNVNTPKDVLKKLVDYSGTIKEIVAKNPMTPSETLEKLVEEGNIFVLESVARNRNAPPLLLKKISEDEDNWVQTQIKRHSELSDSSKEVFNNIPKDKEFAYLGREPEYESFARENLEQELKSEYSYQVIREVAGNPMTPVESLGKLSEHTKLYVQMEVARNEGASPELLRKIIIKGTREQWVKEQIEKKLESPKDLKGILKDVFQEQRFERSRWKREENPNFTFSDLRELLDLMYSSKVVKEVAGNPQAPGDVLEYLAKDNKHYMREKVAGNLQTPENVLEDLANDKEAKVREKVAGNLQTPENVLEDLANDKEAKVREKVAGNLQTPENVLEDLANDKEAKVREKVAGNQNTPAEVLQKFL